MSSFVRFLGAVSRSGVRDSFSQLIQMGDVKWGQQVGTDENGNRYFQNDEWYPGLRSRWVRYHSANIDGGIPDPTTIPPLHHAWMHHVTDRFPGDPTLPPKPIYALPHTPNLTGTQHAYRMPHLGGQLPAIAYGPQPWHPGASAPEPPERPAPAAADFAPGPAPHLLVAEPPQDPGSTVLDASPVADTLVLPDSPGTPSRPIRPSQRSSQLQGPSQQAQSQPAEPDHAWQL